MKYKGKEIGYRPTLSMVKEFIKKMKYDFDASECYGKDITADLCEGYEIEFRIEEDSKTCIRIEDIIYKVNNN